MPRVQPSQARSKERVEAIYEATRRILRRAGVEEVTVGNIAEEAGFTAASVYRYFSDAQAIITSLALTTLDELHREMEVAYAQIRSVEDLDPVLTAAFHHYVQRFKDDRALRELWCGTLVSHDLISLNIADSRRNGALMARTIAPFSGEPVDVLSQRCFLLAQLIGAGVGLLLEVPEDEAAILESELSRVVGLALARPASVAS